MKVCKVGWCNEKHWGKGYCHRHLEQMRKTGKILKRTPADPNKIIIKDDVAEIYLYNKQSKEVARAIIDAEDVGKIKAHKWHLSAYGYATTNLPKGKQVGIQHIVLGIDPCRKNQVDHKNRNRTDNRKSNLRICTQTENIWNSRLPINNTSGYKGVYKHDGKWQAMICVKSKLIHLGLFKTKVSAAKAYNEAVVKCRDKYAYLNGCGV